LYELLLRLSLEVKRDDLDLLDMSIENSLDLVKHLFSDLAFSQLLTGKSLLCLQHAEGSLFGLDLFADGVIAELEVAIVVLFSMLQVVRQFGLDDVRNVVI
jgi:hypothetical protein